MENDDRRLLDRLKENDKLRHGDTEDGSWRMQQMLEELKEFGCGFVEGLMLFLQNLVPGGPARRNLGRCDRRSRPKEKPAINFEPDKVFYGTPIGDPTLEDTTKRLTQDAGKSPPNHRDRCKLPHHRRF